MHYLDYWHNDRTNRSYWTLWDVLFYHQQSLRLLKHELFVVSEEDSQDYEEEETQEDYPDEGDAADEEDTKKESDSGIMTLNK